MILMAALDPESNAILEAGRRALRATSLDRDRIEAALRGRVGLDALPLDVMAKPLAPSAFWRFGPSAVIGTCLVGCALFFALRMRPAAIATDTGDQLQLSPSAESTAPAAATDSSGDQPRTAAPAISAIAPLVTVPSSAAAPLQEDNLAQEVALLLRATSALSAGRAVEALKTLNEHQRRFPNGILSQERSAAKAQALCSLGRLNEGRAELAHLAPRSLAANRAKQVCDSSPTPGE